ncbi:SDR family NAD(P)-dependent oxidoreductase [Caulobacter sp. KR2-114]|uniref:SDR family NAD(P)-dependent oxidoreductase n=1 Tax=Caulobacter sp. KR2-114 TaxID=3400912 RepID=UPI003C02B185
MTDPTSADAPSILIVGASRGLGAAMAAEFAGRGWRVTGTVRGDGAAPGRTALHALAEQRPDQVAIETLDITRPEQIAALAGRLAGARFDMLFVNAGVANGDRAETFADISTDDFTRMMQTNVLGVMRTVEGLQDLVRADGLIGVMSSGQGSVANNTTGGGEIYRATKAALNQSLRSYAARHARDPHAGGRRALVLMAPGWIRTDMGGPDAPFGMEEAIPKVVDVLVARQGQPGLAYLDRFGATVPW